jgi:hypothetical protein
MCAQSVQLIDAQTDRHLWVQSYDRTLTDSLALEGELATEIASAVGATLTPQEKALVASSRRTIPLLTMLICVVARLKVDHGSISRTWSVRSTFLSRRAVKLDPNFALAWASLLCAERELLATRSQTQRG